MKLILIDESIIECQAAELNEGWFITNGGLLIPAENVTEITDNTPECVWWDKQVGKCRQLEYGCQKLVERTEMDVFKRIMESIIGHIEALFLIMFLKMIADWNDLGSAKSIMTWLMNGGINVILFYRLLEAIECAEDVGIKMPWSKKRNK